MTAYDRAYYRTVGSAARRSAEVVVPIVVDLIQPVSVVDVGCGTGAWLAAFRGHGAEDVLGIDGAHVDREDLDVPADRFQVRDLTQPVELPRRFDLVVSLEVAEHLPPEAAGPFVASLTRLGPVVLFSAAIPRQGGVGHRNEQWPDYWVQRFSEHGFVAWDLLRPALWDEPAVAWWYAQNAVVYAHPEHAPEPVIARLGPPAAPRPLVHPRRYEQLLWSLDRERLQRDIAEVVPDGEPVALIDGDRLGIAVVGRREVLSVPDRSTGPPADDDQALSALAEVRRRGAAHVVLAWPAFWWRDEYPGFAAELSRVGVVLRDNSRATIWRLAPAPPPDSAAAPLRG